jgi:hypothetical protein
MMGDSMSDRKSWPVLETWVNTPARQLTFQVWDGHGDKWDGTDFTCTLKIKLGETVTEAALAMTALEAHSGLYYATYDFAAAGEYDSQITVTNGATDTDLCEPVTINVREPI